MGFWVIPSDLCKPQTCHGPPAWNCWINSHLRRRTLFRLWTSRRKLRRLRPELMWPNTTETIRSQQKPTVTSWSKLIKNSFCCWDPGFRLQAMLWNAKCLKLSWNPKILSLKILKHPGHFEAVWVAVNEVWIWFESLCPWYLSLTCKDDLHVIFLTLKLLWWHWFQRLSKLLNFFSLLPTPIGSA